MQRKKDWFIKACSSSFHEDNDEDLKVVDVTSIESLFSNINLDKYQICGRRYEHWEMISNKKDRSIAAFIQELNQHIRR